MSEHLDYSGKEIAFPDAPKNPRGGGKRVSQATKLVRLAVEAGAELFHDPEGDAFARLLVTGHHEVWPLRRKQFKSWLRRLYFEEYAGAPHGQALESAIGVLEAKGLYDGACHRVHTRVAELDGVLYHDLVNDDWEVVEITGDGWRVVREAPVRFRRTRGMEALPQPLPGGSLAGLRPFINADSDDDLVLFVGWLVQCLRARGPFLGYLAVGEQGSAKTTRGRLARKLVDPNAAPVRSAPRKEDDLMIAATNGWIVTLDNLSYLSNELSDGLCRLATGGGLSKRQLYTDAEEVILDAQRPIFITSIEEVATRGDLLDRLVIAQTPRLTAEKRQPEDEFWADFDERWPSLYGALLDAASCALRNLSTVQFDRLPRMADAARWVSAAEPALRWESGTFLNACNGNQKDAHEVALDASPLAQHLQRIATIGFEGTASELLEQLTGLADDEQPRQRSWPKNAQSLSGKLQRLAPALREAGFAVELARAPGGQRRRLISLRTAAQNSVPPVPPPAGHGHNAARFGTQLALAAEPVRAFVPRQAPTGTAQQQGRDARDAALRAPSHDDQQALLQGDLEWYGLPANAQAPGTDQQGANEDEWRRIVERLAPGAAKAVQDAFDAGATMGEIALGFKLPLPVITVLLEKKPG